MKWHKVTMLAKFFLVFAVFAGNTLAQQEEEGTVVLRSTITGNQEQPKVLYIVPWKAVSASELENQTIQSQLDIVFGHVEPVELRRELIYLKELSRQNND
ncbi:MAG: hypothetical protein WDZ30_00755 [Cellvibrionaceae bacterium]